MMTTMEIADREYWKELSYDDAGLYISLLVIDGKTNWRLLQDAHEYAQIFGTYEVGHYWYSYNNGRGKPYRKYLTIPVRDNL